MDTPLHELRESVLHKIKESALSDEDKRRYRQKALMTESPQELERIAAEIKRA